MILVSITNNKFIYKNNNDNKIIKLSRTSETINKLIQYELNNNDTVFNNIDIEFILLLLDLNEKGLLKKIKINECDFHVLRMCKYNNVSLYNIFEELYSSTSKTCAFNSSSIITYKSYYLIGSNKSHVLHRENDLPALIYSNGTKVWYIHDRIHRENDLPALIFSNGTKEWYKNGSLHRENDLPAVISSNGTKDWYIHDRRHRENDLPAVILFNGKKEWYKNNLHHRENDLPSIIFPNGDKHWRKNGVNHRYNDLPAIILSNGDKYWYKNGVLYKYKCNFINYNI